jgi:hypothetical protein
VERKKIIIIALYRPLNINIQQDESSYKQLLDVTKAYNLTVTINVRTRVTDSSATTVDQIITNMPAESYYIEVTNSLLSDYYAQCITFNMKAPQQTKCYKEVRNVSQANIKDLCSSIQN